MRKWTVEQKAKLSRKMKSYYNDRFYKELERARQKREAEKKGAQK